jgi:hypothetical protein
MLCYLFGMRLIYNFFTRLEDSIKYYQKKELCECVNCNSNRLQDVSRVCSTKFGVFSWLTSGRAVHKK